MRVDDADRLGDGVDGLLPLTLGGGQELHQTGVLECDGGLGEHGRDECELGFAEHPRAVAGKGYGAHGAGSGDERGSEPGAGHGVPQLCATPPGFFLHLPGEGERPTPQRQLKQRVVGAGRHGVRVVRHRQPVRLGVK